MDGHIWVGGLVGGQIWTHECKDECMLGWMKDGWMFEHIIKFYSAESIIQSALYSSSAHCLYIAT